MLELNPWLAGILASLLAGLSTSLGAVFLLFRRNLSPRLVSGLLGFGGGVMLAASAFSLIPPAFDLLDQWASRNFSLGLVLLGIGFGSATIYLIDVLLPHEHFFKGKEGIESRRLSRAWLLVLAIAIHNFPEGFAVGVGYGSGDLTTGNVITMGIILQNLPEGLIAATALVSVGYSRGRAFGIAALTGLVETCGGLVGLSLASLGAFFVPLGLTFAAGAMIYVVCHEVIPESFRRGYERTATFGLMFGFMLMLTLDRLFS